MQCKEIMEHLTKCDKCFDEFLEFMHHQITSHAGSATSEKKAKASRENGKLGGRPKKVKDANTR